MTQVNFKREVHHTFFPRCHKFPDTEANLIVSFPIGHLMKDISEFRLFFKQGNYESCVHLCCVSLKEGLGIAVAGRSSESLTLHCDHPSNGNPHRLSSLTRNKQKGDLVYSSREKHLK